jgi:hypothetical protein
VLSSEIERIGLKNPDQPANWQMIPVDVKKFLHQPDISRPGPFKLTEMGLHQRAIPCASKSLQWWPKLSITHI